MTILVWNFNFHKSLNVLVHSSMVSQFSKSGTLTKKIYYTLEIDKIEEKKCSQTISCLNKMVRIEILLE